MMMKQIRSTDGTGTLTYLIGDEITGTAAVIDPTVHDAELIGAAATELGFSITTIIDTHTHADHVSGAGRLREMTGGKIVMHRNSRDKWKVADQGNAFGIGDILRANAAVKADRLVDDGDVIEVGALRFEVLHTPGHTDDHIALKLRDNLFTGDLLLIGQAGRSDLPGGDAGQQYDSLTLKVLTLPDDTKLHPGHDYEENEFSCLGEEKLNNPFLQVRTKEEYRTFVRNFFPPIADKGSDDAMVLQCGTHRVSTSREPFTNISPAQLAAMLHGKDQPFLLDVREPSELTAFGAVPGVVNIPAGQFRRRLGDLPADTARPVVVICQSGGRSYEAAHFLATHGYSNVYNLQGGTSAWMRERPMTHA